MRPAQWRELNVLERIAADDGARSELLWLYAQQKEDEVAARDLEGEDPTLVRRLVDAGFEVENRDGEDPLVRRQRFSRLWYDCYQHHARRMQASY
jgi:hypothetical protein